MGQQNQQKLSSVIAPIVLVSRDREFVTRFRLLALASQGTMTAVRVFEDPVPFLVFLMERPPAVVLYDLDCDLPERNSEILKAIRLICRHVPIVVSATEHCKTPFPLEDEVGIFYRIVKSAPDSELQSVMESAQRIAHR